MSSRQVCLSNAIDLFFKNKSTSCADSLPEIDIVSNEFSIFKTEGIFRLTSCLSPVNNSESDITFTVNYFDNPSIDFQSHKLILF